VFLTATRDCGLGFVFFGMAELSPFSPPHWARISALWRHCCKTWSSTFYWWKCSFFVFSHWSCSSQKHTATMCWEDVQKTARSCLNIGKAFIFALTFGNDRTQWVSSVKALIQCKKVCCELFFFFKMYPHSKRGWSNTANLGANITDNLQEWHMNGCLVAVKLTSIFWTRWLDHSCFYLLH